MKKLTTKHILFLLIGLGMAGLSMAFIHPPQEYRVIVKGTYNRSAQIWGVYELGPEEITIIKEDQSFSTTSESLANLVFKKGKAVFIRPVIEETKLSYEVQPFPYENFKKEKRMSINPQGLEKEIFKLYKKPLEKALKEYLKDSEFSPLTNDNFINIGAIDCHKSWEKVSCELPFKIKI